MPEDPTTEIHRLAAERDDLQAQLNAACRERDQLEGIHRQWLGALDAVDAAICMHDREFRVLRANRAYQRLTGFPFDALLGRPYHTLFPLLPGPLPSCVAELRAPGVHEEEFKAGGKIYRSRAFSVRDDAGDYLHSVHILDDITDLRSREQALHDSRERLQGIFDTTASGIAIYRAVDEGNDFEFVDFNPGAEQIEHLERDHVIGRRLTEVFPGVAAFGLLAVLRRVWCTGRAEHYEPKLYKDDRIAGWRENQVFKLSDGDVVALYRDLTGQKRAEAELQVSEKSYRALFENSPDSVAHCRMIFDEQGRPVDFLILRVNSAYYAATGLKDVEGKTINEVIPGYGEHNPESLATFGEVAKMGEPTRWKHYLKDLNRWYSFVVYSPAPGEIVIVTDDITARKKGEQALQASEARYRALFDSSRDALMVVVPPEWRVIEGNPAAMALFGVSQGEDWRRLTPLDFSPEFQPDGRPSAEKIGEIAQVVLHEGAILFEWEHQRRDGSRFMGEVLLTRIEADGQTLFRAMIRDISERKRHEQALQAGHDLLRSVIENIPIRVFWKDRESRYLGCNTLFARDAGFDSPDALLGKDDFAMGWSDEADLYRADDRAVMELDTPKLDFEEPQTTPDGGEIWLRTSKVPLHGDTGTVRGVLGIYADVTEEHRNRLVLERANRALRTISAGNSVLIHAEEEGVLLEAMCRVAVEQGGYRFAWIGYALDDPGKTIEPQAWAGKANGYLDVLTLTWSGEGCKAIPSGEAIRTGAIQIVHNVALYLGDKGWSDATHRFGFASCVALPLHDGDARFGVLVLLDDAPGVFGDQEVAILTEMAGNLAFGVQTLRIKQRYTGHERRLRDTLLETVQTVASIVEMRDTYTAGHQRRVAVLAQAIGHALGWDEERCQGLYLAGVVHDVGKISIPAEILSKPGRLSAIEYEYVKTHAQSGFEILMPVHFPWPIAEIVHQHHERLDGSGYPQGLKADDILPEAKVLMVADVVEAIASHRPYRPSLGMGTALEEIVGKRGTLFDPEAVDACLRLIRDKGFVFGD